MDRATVGYIRKFENIVINGGQVGILMKFDGLTILTDGGFLAKKEKVQETYQERELTKGKLQRQLGNLCFIV